jgi:serine protease Do
MRVLLIVCAVLALVAPAAAADRPQPPETFAPVADAVKDAVFSVVRPGPEEDGDDEDDAIDNDVLRQLFDVQAGRPFRTLGAAVMIDPDGIAVTSSRVVREATTLDLVARDGQRYRARLVGRDDRTDIAVLRVTTPAALPTARMGDSDEVRIGDWVLAVGSPYGFEASVSAGIVSARARVSSGGAWGDMLQTDAAVNVGSAGGPLVNTRGEVIGLTTMAAARGSGIAFAVPSNLVGTVVRDLVTHGRVVRSWLGVASQPLTADLARAFHAPVAGGLLLSDVVAGGPAARAGLTRGTILLALDGRPLRSRKDLEHALDATTPGRLAKLTVWRRGRQETIGVLLAQEPDTRHPAEWARPLLGLMVESITPEGGVFVSGVVVGSPAAAAGVIPGDVVREIADRTIRTFGDFELAARSITPTESTTLLVQRGRTPLYLVLRPAR